MLFFQRKELYKEIAQMIRIITASPINTTHNDYMDRDTYRDDKFYIECTVKPVNKFQFKIYFNNELVFKNIGSSSSSFTADGFNAKYDVHNLEYWLAEFAEIYKICNEAYEKQKIINKKKEQEEKEKRIHYEYEKNIEERRGKIKKIFSLVSDSRLCNGYYEDDKIIIDNITYQNHTAPDYSNSMDYTTYSGRIRLKDGSVLMDSYTDVFHPGNWENYVIDLTNTLLEKLKNDNKLQKEKYASQEKERELEKQKIYRLNHSPIDDSKYFR